MGVPTLPGKAMEPHGNHPPSQPEEAVKPRTEALFRCVVPPFRLGELLLRIGEKRLTGRLSLTSSTAERTLYFFSGCPVFAQSSLFSERIGAIGVRHGYFSRDDVKRALELARKHGRELGRALLELGVVDGQALFRLLSLQLIDQLATACGNAEARALFSPDAHAVDHVAILRVHPLSAALSTVRGLSEGERERTLAAFAGRPVKALPLPALAGEWLVQLGYMGDPRGLLQGQVTVGAIRSRLVARMRPQARDAFGDNHGGAGEAAQGRISAHQLAAHLTLTLLLTGSVELEAGEVGPDEDELSTLEVTLRRALEPGALRLPLSVPDGPPQRRSSLGDALNAYLFESRPDPMSAHLNVTGPAAEIEQDDPVLNPLLTLYLTIKPEARAEAILGVEQDPTPDSVAEGYAHYHEFLGSLLHEDSSPLVRAKVAELHHCIDWAFSAMLPGSEAARPADATEAEQTVTEAEPAAESFDFSGEPTPTEFFESVEAFEAAHSSQPGPPNPAVRSSVPPANTPSPSDPARRESLEELASRVEAQLNQGDWTAARETLEERMASERLSPTLRLSLAIAQREEARSELNAPANGAFKALLWFAIGVAIGWFLREPNLLPW